MGAQRPAGGGAPSKAEGAGGAEREAEHGSKMRLVPVPANADARKNGVVGGSPSYQTCWPRAGWVWTHHGAVAPETKRAATVQ